MNYLDLKHVPGDDDNHLLDNINLTCGGTLGNAVRRYVRTRILAQKELRDEKELKRQLDHAEAARDEAVSELLRLRACLADLPVCDREAFTEAAHALHRVMRDKPAAYTTSDPKYTLITQPCAHPLVRLARNRTT